LVLYINKSSRRQNLLDFGLMLKVHGNSCFTVFIIAIEVEE